MRLHPYMKTVCNILAEIPEGGDHLGRLDVGGTVISEGT